MGRPISAVRPLLVAARSRLGIAVHQHVPVALLALVHKLLRAAATAARPGAIAQRHQPSDTGRTAAQVGQASGERQDTL